MPYSDEPFATDEALYGLARGDYYPLLASCLIGSGVDGSFPGVSPWDFTSAAVDLATIGLAPGMVGRVRPPGSPESRWLPCAVHSVAGGVVKLRRPLSAPTSGVPFGAMAGAGAWAWEFYSAAGTVGSASLDLRRRFRLQSDTPLESADDLAAAAVYRSLADLYLAASKEVTAGERDTYFGKYKEFWGRFQAETKGLEGVYPGGVSSPASEPVVFELEAGRFADAETYPGVPGYRRYFP